MQECLKKNICDLPRYAMNRDIKDIPARRAKYIGDALEYASKYWMTHLRSACALDSEDLLRLGALVRDFAEHRMLPWFEVLSIVGGLQTAISSISDLQTWVNDVSVF